jgi:hypothetical protein
LIPKEDLAVAGKFWSEKLDVVKSNNWANIKEETGNGGAIVGEPLIRMIESCRGRIPWNKGKKSNLFRRVA